MTTRVTVTGPFSPADMQHLLTGEDRRLASAIQGYRGVAVQALVSALLATGAQVEVVTEAAGLDRPLDLTGERFRLLVAPLRERPRSRALDLFRQERTALRTLIESTEAEVVSAHWTYEFAWAAIASGRPVLVTARDAPLTILRHYRDAYRAARTLMALAVRARVSHLAAVSPYLADRWRTEMRYRGPIHVLPNCSPGVAAVRDHARATGPVIVGVADDSALKNVRSLVDAFRLLRRTRADASMELVGRGLGPSDSLARSLGDRRDGITFHGVVGRQALAGVLGRGTVFVHPSLEESFGMVLLEAMAAGLPVVAGAGSGAVPWVLGQGDAGLLVDVRRPDAIADAVAGLLADPDGARRLVERGRVRLETSFSPTAVAEAYLRTLDRIRPRRVRQARPLVLEARP